MIKQQADEFSNTVRQRIDRMESEMNENSSARIKQHTAEMLDRISKMELEMAALINKAPSRTRLRSFSRRASTSRMSTLMET